MRIGDLASQLGINPRTIRYYERVGLLPAAERTSGNYRTYGEADADRLIFIKTAQRLGLSLDEIREILTFRERGEAPCGYVRQVLRRELVAIDDRIDELRALRRELVKLEAESEKLPSAANGYCQIITHDLVRKSSVQPVSA